MSLIGVAISVSADHNPMRASCWQVPCASAIERASNPGCVLPAGAEASIRCTGSRPFVSAETASASVAPVIPPPTIMMLILFPCRRHQRFNVIGFFYDVAGEDFDAVCGDQNIVFDTDPDTAIGFRYVSIWCDVQARLDGDHHTWFQRTAAVNAAVVADVMNVHPQPVRQTMHKERTVRLLAEQSIDVA